MPKVQQFNGGVNSRKAEHLLAINEAPIFNNIDIEEEVLKPIKGLSQEILGLTDEARYIKYEDDIITLAKTPHTLVEYQNKIYYSVLGDFVQVKDDTTEGDLGFVSPQIIGATLGTTIPATPVLADLTITHVDFNSSSFFIDGELYQFAFTRVDSNGIESIPFLHSITLATSGSQYGYFIFNLPYDWRIYQKIAGQWKVYTLLVPQWPTTSFLYELATWPALNDIDINLRVAEAAIGWITNADIDAMILNNVFVNETTYLVTVYSSELGWESEPSIPLVVKPADGGTDVITLIIDSISDSRIDTVKLYRLGGTLTDFTLVSNIENPIFPLTISDHAPDTNIAGNKILDAENNDKMFAGLTNLTVANGQLVGTYGTKLYFSELGRLYAIPPTNYRDFKETLTSIFIIDSGLLIFSATRTWLLNTSNLAVGKVIELSDEFGCVGHKTIVGYQTGAMWASLAGLCTSAGGKVNLITKDKIGYVDLDITRAKMHNETYFGFTDRGVCYALDLRYAPAFISYTFSLLDDYDVTTEVRQVYIEGTELKVLFGSLVDVDSLTVFNGTSNEVLSWKSPKFLDGSYTELKTYKDFYVRATAGLTFKIYIDETLISSTVFHTTDTHNIKIPQKQHQGYSIQFEIFGTGTIHEIEYKAMGRQNGR